MAKYKVLKTFKDAETKDVLKKGSEIVWTVKRADKAEKALEKWGGGFLKRFETVETKKNEGEDPKNEAKDEEEQEGDK